MRLKKIEVSLVLFLFIACSNNDDAISHISLVGIWEKSVDVVDGEISGIQSVNHKYISQFIFKDDKTFEFYHFLRNITLGDKIAYSQKYFGTYTIEKDTLHLSYKYWGAEPLDDQYSELRSLDDLVLINDSETWSFSYSIDPNNKELLLDFSPCDPLENCIDKVLYFRVQ